LQLDVSQLHVGGFHKPYTAVCYAAIL